VESQSWYKNAWFPMYNSVLFLAFGFVLLNYYGMIHWEIIGDNYPQLEGKLKDSLFNLMSRLGAYKVCGLISLFFAVWGCFCKPRWAIPVNIFLGVVSCFMIVVTM
jgi:hypothetical protein